MDYTQAIRTANFIYRRYVVYIYPNEKRKKYLNEIEKNNNIEKIVKDKYTIEAIKKLKENNYSLNELIKNYRSYLGKKKRIEKRINKMNIENVWFCTWTIEDKYLNKDHKRKLKELYNGYNFIINVDIGKNTKRKHYHGVIESKEEPKKWEYGFCKFIKIRISEKNKQNIATYINKITNHAIKVGTEKENIIYSRNKKI